MGSKRKVKSVEQLRMLIKRLRKNGKKIVFTNGCFDILHIGHIRYLEKAKKLGNVLIVAVNSDTSVRRIKGKGRPIIPQDERVEILASLECVDYVVIFDEVTPARIIERLQPDVLVKGKDYKDYQIAGAGIVEKNGGRIVRIPLEKGKSTTAIIRKIWKLLPKR